jgi:hypothetical protein
LYITGCSLLAFIILYAPGNLAATDAFFLAVSGNTESGINTYVEAFRQTEKTGAEMLQQRRLERPQRSPTAGPVLLPRHHQSLLCQHRTGVHPSVLF